MSSKPWRSRFVARLVADVSRPAPERAAAHPRLFPYAITDLQATPDLMHHRLRLVLPKAKFLPKGRDLPGGTEDKMPVRPPTVWHYVKR